MVAISQASPITIAYVSGGAGVKYDIFSFSTVTSIAGCIIDCNYGDTCGGSLSGSDV